MKIYLKNIFYNKEKSQIVLLISLVILFAILSIGAGLTLVTIREMGMTKNIEESAKALQAADAGMEFALYKTGDEPPGLDEPLNEAGENWLCDNNHWVHLVDSDSYYCIKYTGDSTDPESIKSIGRAGNIRRAISSETFDGLDQFSINPGWDFDKYECDFSCEWTGLPNLNMQQEIRPEIGPAWWKVCTEQGMRYSCCSTRLGQTFQVDTTGTLTKINVFRGFLSSCPFSNLVLTMELRQNTVDGPLLAESELLINESPLCPSCKVLSFIFDPSDPANNLEVNEGQRYAFTIKGRDSQCDPSHLLLCLFPALRLKVSERETYIPGQAWYYEEARRWNQNPSSCWWAFTGCFSNNSDLAFAIYINSHPGGSFEEVKP